MYADRYKSAENTFQKMLATNPNIIDAIYWLGQTYLDDDKNDAARQVYEKALMTNGNAPLLLVGMGHVELVENKTNEARQRFETAITLTRTKKGDDPVILTAIGRANVDAKPGDLTYAIEKLELAVQRDPKKADAYLELGNAYRKANPGQGGGKAYENYKMALQVNPSFVYPYIRIAKLFETQRNWELVLENLNKAVEIDPNFSLGYYELFYYNFFRKEYDKANSFFTKYVGSRSGEDQTEHDYLNSQLCWARSDWDCAIAKAEGVKTSMGAKVKPRVLRQLSYSYLGKSDFASAKRNVDEFFAKEKDGFAPADYKLKAEIYAGSGVPCEELYSIYLAGAEADSVLQTKIEYLRDAADDFKKRNCKKQEADMRMVIYQNRKNPSDGELFNVGLTYHQAQDYKKAIDIFNQYAQKNPDSLFGHLWIARASFAIDTTMVSAVPSYEKTLQVSESDKIRYKNYGIEAGKFLAGYYNNMKNDRSTAISYLQKALVFDTSNTSVKDLLNILQRAPAPKGNQPKTPAKTGTKPAAALKKQAAKKNSEQELV